MINRVATKYGQSFRGVAAYVLHDKRTDQQKAAGVGAGMSTAGQTKNRVAWTDTRNLATKDPNLAWRVMSANYLDRERRKEEHGVAKTGRKNKGPVCHISFSWHPEEKALLKEEEMKRFAGLALKRLGFEELQAIIVCHSDEEQPHIHLIINRTHPKTGRMVNCFHDQDKLSALARKYERERGKVFCKQREENAKAREREKQKAKGERLAVRDASAPKNIHRLQQEVANDNRQTAALLAKQRQQAGELLRRRDALKKLRREQWKALDKAHKQRLADIRTQTQTSVRQAGVTIRDKYKPAWYELRTRHEIEHGKFEEGEKTAVGRVKNVLGAIDFRALLRGYHEDRNHDGRAVTLKEVFSVMGDAGVRLRVEEARHEREEQQLHQQQRAEELLAKRTHKAAERKALIEARGQYLANRSSLMLRHKMEAAALRTSWEAFRRQFDQAWAAEKTASQEAARRAAAARTDQSIDRASDASHGRPAAPPTRAGDLLPKVGSKEAAKIIDSERRRQERVADLLRQRKLDREKDRGDQSH